jgi:hypothetical protein
MSLTYSPVKIAKDPPQIATETILTQYLQKHIWNTRKKVQENISMGTWFNLHKFKMAATET